MYLMTVVTRTFFIFRLLFLIITVLFIIPPTSAVVWQSPDVDMWYNPTNNSYGIEYNSSSASSINVHNTSNVSIRVNLTRNITFDRMNMFFTSNGGTPTGNVTVNLETVGADGNASGTLIQAGATANKTISTNNINTFVFQNNINATSTFFVNFSLPPTINSGNYHKIAKLSGYVDNLFSIYTGSGHTFQTGIPQMGFGDSTVIYGNWYSGTGGTNAVTTNTVTSTNVYGEYFVAPQTMTMNNFSIFMKYGTDETALARIVIKDAVGNEKINMTNTTAVTTSADWVFFNGTSVEVSSGAGYYIYPYITNAAGGLVVYSLWSPYNPSKTWGGSQNYYYYSSNGGNSLTTAYTQYDMIWRANTTASSGYNISGYIKNTNGVGVGSVTVLENVSGTSTLSAANGYYSFSLPNASYKFTASKSGYIRNITTATVSGAALTNQNITTAIADNNVTLTMRARRSWGQNDSAIRLQVVDSTTGDILVNHSITEIYGFGRYIGSTTTVNQSYSEATGTPLSFNLSGLVAVGVSQLQIQVNVSTSTNTGKMFQLWDISLTKDNKTIGVTPFTCVNNHESYYCRMPDDESAVLILGDAGTNRYSGIKTSVLSNLPDFSVSPASVTTNPVIFDTIIGHKVYVNTTVKNNGNATGSNAYAQLYIDDVFHSNSAPFTTASGANTTVSLNFTLTKKPTKVRVQIVPTGTENKKINNNVSFYVIKRHPYMVVQSRDEIMIAKYPDREPYTLWNTSAINAADSSLGKDWTINQSANERGNNIFYLGLAYQTTQNPKYAEAALGGLGNITESSTQFRSTNSYIHTELWYLAAGFDLVGDYIYTKYPDRYISIQKNLSLIGRDSAWYVYGTSFGEMGETVARYGGDGDANMFIYSGAGNLQLALLDQTSSEIDSVEYLNRVMDSYHKQRYMTYNHASFTPMLFEDGQGSQGDYRVYYENDYAGLGMAYQNTLGTLFDYPYSKGFFLIPMDYISYFGTKPNWGSGKKATPTSIWTYASLFKNDGNNGKYYQYLIEKYINNSFYDNEREGTLFPYRYIYYDYTYPQLEPRYWVDGNYEKSFISSNTSEKAITTLRSGWDYTKDMQVQFLTYPHALGSYQGDGGFSFDLHAKGAYLLADGGDVRDGTGAPEKNATAKMLAKLADEHWGSNSFMLDDGMTVLSNGHNLTKYMFNDSLDFVEGSVYVRNYAHDPTDDAPSTPVTNPPTWNRSFVFPKDYAILLDRVEAPGSHKYGQVFMFGFTEYTKGPNSSTKIDDIGNGTININDSGNVDWQNLGYPPGTEYNDVKIVRWTTERDINGVMSGNYSIELAVNFIPFAKMQLNRSLENYGWTYGKDASRPFIKTTQEGNTAKFMAIMYPRNASDPAEGNLTVTNLTVTGGTGNDYAAKMTNGSNADTITFSDGENITAGNHTTDANTSFSRWNGVLNYYFIEDGKNFTYQTTDYLKSDKKLNYLYNIISGYNQYIKVNGTNATNITVKVSDVSSNYTVMKKADGVYSNYSNKGIVDASHIWINLSLSTQEYLITNLGATEGPIIEYMPPTPISLTVTPGSSFTTSFSWSDGAGNITNSNDAIVQCFYSDWLPIADSYWINGTELTNPESVNCGASAAHGYFNTSVYAVNTSMGTYTVNQTPATDSVQISNNPITLSGILDSYSIDETDTLSITAGYTDIDGDTGTFSDDSDKWNIGTQTGIISWESGYGDAGSYTWQVCVDDGYGSQSCKSFDVIVSTETIPEEYTPPSITNIANGATGYTHQVITFTVNQSNALSHIKYSKDFSFSMSTDYDSGSNARTVNITGLDNGSTYNYKIIAYNVSNPAFFSESSIHSFTTLTPPTPTPTPVPTVPPSVMYIVTLSATNTTTKGATLQANISNVGTQTDTWFEYGANPSAYIYRTTNQTTNANGTLSAPVSGLPIVSNKLYYYRAAAWDGSTLSHGAQHTFITSPVPAVADYDFDKNFDNLTDTGLEPEKLSNVGSAPYTDMMGNIFWGFLFAMIFVMIWIRQEDVTLSCMLGLIIGSSVWAFMPEDWTAMAMSLTVISFAGIVYSLLRGRQ